MNPALALAVAAAPAFVASVVEFVEAFTIVLAVGTTRGWRAPLWGVAASVVTLAVIVTALGTPLVIYHDQVSQWFHLVLGTLLLLFGMRWLRKAVLLAGLEVAFSVLALGAQDPTSLNAPIGGAIAAFLVTMAAGALLHRPLSFVPENWMKFVVGVMLTT